MLYEVITRYYENGNKEFEGVLVNGEKNGEWNYWYHDSSSKIKVTYKNGLKHGMQTSWNVNGQKSNETNFVEGKKQGKATWWHEDGKLDVEGNFENDVQEGLWTYWRTDGQKGNEGVITSYSIHYTKLYEKVGIYRKGEPDLIPFTITRDKIPLYSIDVSYMIDNNIGYIKLSKFSRTTFKEFQEAVAKLKSKGMSKLIFDLRGNSGGYMDIRITSYNVCYTKLLRWSICSES